MYTMETMFNFSNNTKIYIHSSSIWSSIKAKIYYFNNRRCYMLKVQFAKKKKKEKTQLTMKKLFR